MLARRCLLLLLLPLAGTLACSESGPEAPVSSDDAPETYARGSVRLADHRLPMPLFVAHAPQMDLRTGCQLARAADPAVPLCFDESPRPTLWTLRIEHREGLRGGEAVAMLRARQEGAHFVVEPSGGLYQVLDMAFASRRDGAYQRAEVRVLSGSRKGHEALRDMLLDHFPLMEAEVVPFPVPDPAPERAP